MSDAPPAPAAARPGNGLAPRLTILLFTCIIYFFSYFQRVAVPGTIFNQLQTEFAVSASAVAALSAIYLYIYSAMQLLAGLMADRAGGAKTLLIGGALLAAGSLLFPLAGGLGGLYAGRALIAVGAGMVYISVLKVIDDLFEPARFPLFLSLAVVIGFSGGLAATLPFERAVHLLGWRVTLLAVGAACALALAAVARLLRGRKHRPAASGAPGPHRQLAGIIRNRRAWPLFFAGPINFSTYFLFQAVVGKKMLEDCAGATSSQAAGITFAMMLTTIAWLLFQGFASQRFHRRRPFFILSITSATTGLLIINLALNLAPTTGWLTLGYLLTALGGGNIVIITFIKEMNHPGAAATATGLYNGLIYLVVALSGQLAGLVLDLFRESARHTATAVIYPPAAWRLLVLLCLGASLVALTVALRVREDPPAAAGAPAAGGVKIRS